MTEVAFKLKKLENCFLEVKGLENEKGLYDLEQFTFENTATLNILIKLNSNKVDETIVDQAVCEHNFDEQTGDPLEDFTIHKFPQDGLFKIVRFIIYTMTGIQNVCSNFSCITQKTYAYEDGKIYKLEPGIEYKKEDGIWKYFDNESGKWMQLKELDSLKEMLEWDDIFMAVTNLDADPSTPFEKPYIFNLCNLWKCYYNQANKILGKLCSDRCSKEDTFNRDMLWMAINAIQYSLDNGMFFEAQCILDRITQCNGICPESTLKSNSKNCGCRG